MLERRRAGDSETDDAAAQGIVPMETPFLMDQVMDDGMAACSIMWMIEFMYEWFTYFKGLIVYMIVIFYYEYLEHE